MKAAIAIIFTAFIFCGCKPTASLQKWEYKIIVLDNEVHQWQLTDMGKWAESVNTNTGESDSHDLNLDYKSEGFFEVSSNVAWSKLGNNGWELVAAIPQTETERAEDIDKNVYPNTRTSKIIFIFKRPAQ